jgi:hypothetical protein
MKKFVIIVHDFRFVIPGLIALVFYLALPYFPRVTEYVFSRFIFRLYSVPVGSLVSLLPFSLTEILAVLLIPALVICLILFIRRMLLTQCRKATCVEAARTCGWVLSVALLIYMVAHGNNFYRMPTEELLGLDISGGTPQQLAEICADLAKKASAEREGLKEDENGVMTLSEDVRKTLRQGGSGYLALQDEYPFLWGIVNNAKPVMLSYQWSYTGISGMYFPFLVEANINIDQPDSSIPWSVSHELAHTRGFAREDDSNFYAYLSNINNDSQDFRYSGYLMAYKYCSDALYDYDRQLWLEARAHCSEGMLRDLKARAEYWKRFEGRVNEMTTDANDAFLQAQGAPDGVQSYGRVVDLIIGYYKTLSLI